MCIIYKITNLINNKIYIGKTTKTINDRFKEHLKTAKRKRTYTSYLYNAINTYGESNFKIEIIDTCKNEDDLNSKEVYWIRKFNSQNTEIGYNIMDGGEGGRKCTAYNITEKQRDALDRGRHLPMSNKAKKLLSERRKGCIVSESTREKLRQAQKGKKLSNETKEKMRASHKDKKLPKRTTEQKQHYRETSLGRIHIHKGSIRKNIKKEDLENYIKDGYSLGYYD